MILQGPPGLPGFPGNPGLPVGSFDPHNIGLQSRKFTSPEENHVYEFSGLLVLRIYHFESNCLIYPIRVSMETMAQQVRQGSQDAMGLK